MSRLALLLKNDAGYRPPVDGGGVFWFFNQTASGLFLSVDDFKCELNVK